MVVAHSATPVTRKKTRRSLVKRRGKAVDAIAQTKSTLEPVTVDEPAPVMDDAREDDEVMIDVDPESAPTPSAVPSFAALPTSASSTTTPKSETRRVPIPPHRMTPIKKDWVNIFSPLTEILGLQVRMNVPRRCVEIRVSFFLVALVDTPSRDDDFQSSKHTKDVGALQKGADFVKAYALGFDVNVSRLYESDVSLISASRMLSPFCD